MADVYQWVSFNNLDAQLLLQLPAQPCKALFARLQLATRKLPQSALVATVRALGDKYIAGRVYDNSGHHVNAAHQCAEGVGRYGIIGGTGLRKTHPVPARCRG